jgi:hypothetical protein
LLEQHQREEVIAAVTLQEQAELAELHQQVRRPLNKYGLGCLSCFQAEQLIRCESHACANIRASYSLQVVYRINDVQRLPGCMPATDLFFKVQELDPTDMKLLAPVLDSPALRQLLTCLSKDGCSGGTNCSNPSSSLHSGSASQVGSSVGCTAPTASAQQTGLQMWMANPRVLHLLRQAAKALRQGRISEAQLVQALLHYNQVC